MAESMGPTAAVLARSTPAASVLASACVAAVPWGAGDAAEYMLPLITLFIVHFWASRWRILMPSPFVFLVGLTTDLLTNGPLGFWALLYLLAYGIGAFGPRFRSMFANAFWSLAVLLALAVLGWVISSVYYLKILSPVDIIMGTVMAGALSGVIAWALVPSCARIEQASGPQDGELERI